MTEKQLTKRKKWLILLFKATLLFLFAGFCNDYILSSNSFFATIFFYTLLLAAWYLITRALKKFRFKFYNELFFTGLILLVLLLSVEASLRFVVKNHLDFGEINGLDGRANLYNNSMADAYVWPEPNRSTAYSNNEFKYYREKNNKGLSEINIPPKEKGEIRILCLGDSFTEGAGTSYDSSWVKQVEVLLHESCNGNHITLINAGLSGSDPFFEYQLLKNNLLDYQPDWVIMNVNSSDIFDYLARGGMERFRKDGSIHYKNAPWWYQAYKYSYIIRHFAHDVLHLTKMLNTKEEERHLTAKAIRDINAVGHSMDRLADEMGFRFVMTLQPLHYEIEANQYTFNNFTAITSNLRHTYNLMPCLKESTKQLDKPNDYFWPIDKHFDSKGYQLMGDCIFEYLDSILVSQPNG